jgi:sugar (pentulose or hexulose) kinase
MLDTTLVIDIGKSHAKLLFVDATGQVLAQHGRANRSVPSPLGYPALDLDGLTDWVHGTLAASPHTARCGHAIASTHGAAIVALGDAGVAWAPLDYEFDGVQNTDIRSLDTFADTCSPELPAGLNAARQLAWLQDTHPATFARTRQLLPYAQYWAWWLSGVAASEVSSLGCHTHLWHPGSARFSQLARSRGWAGLFAPLRQAHAVLGPARAATGLPAACKVHVGVHDSNACLARYLGNGGELTVVSSGTWTVLMAPNAPTTSLRAERDMLCNVNVLGQATPTARFMGGREFAALRGDAPADLATVGDVAQLLHSRTLALPSFAPQGGPFRQHTGQVLRAGQAIALEQLQPAERSALAALYCAQLTAWLVLQLRSAPQGTVVVEGPLAQNPLFLGLLQALLPGHRCQASQDTMEGTARGAWLISRWPHAATSPDFLRAIPRLELPQLPAYQADWQQKLAAL